MIDATKSAVGGGGTATLWRCCSNNMARNSATSFRTEGSSSAALAWRTRRSSSRFILSFASATVRAYGLTEAGPATGAELEASSTSRFPSSKSSSSSLLMAIVSSSE